MERRKFIKNTCVFCVGTVGLSAFLTSCSSSSRIFKTNAENGKFIIPLTEFQDKGHLIVRSKSLNYDVFVYKKPNDEYIAVLMKCSHRDAPVQYTSGGLACNEHGSRFTYEGEVTKEPATDPLTKFPVTINQTHLIIQIIKS